MTNRFGRSTVPVSTARTWANSTVAVILAGLLLLLLVAL